MTLLHAIILSILEGLTEFLPISSTGHLILANKLLKIPNSGFLTTFNIFIQLGAIMAVVVLYLPKVFKKFHLWKALILAFLPTAIVGFTLYPFIKQYLLNNPIVTLWALFLGGIGLILIEKFISSRNVIPTLVEGSPDSIPGSEISLRRLADRNDNHPTMDSRLRGNDKKTMKQFNNETIISYPLDPKPYLFIGLSQSISIIPGVSRAAATILGGLFVGLSRSQAVEFSFLLAIPTMAAATGLDLLESGFNFTPHQWFLLTVGFLTAFITALLTVNWFLKFVQHHSFVPFGIYRIVLAVTYWLLVIVPTL